MNECIGEDEIFSVYNISLLYFLYEKASCTHAGNSCVEIQEHDGMQIFLNLNRKEDSVI